MRTSIMAAILMCGLAMLAGCAGPRPLPTIKADADHAYSYRNYAKAESDYQLYLDRRPDANDVRVRLAQSQLFQGNPAGASGHLATALDVDPQNDEILDLCAQSLYASGEREQLQTFLARAASERGRVSDYLRIAEYQQLLGNPDEAQQALITAAKIDGGRDVKVQLAIADFYKGVGRRDQMVRRLRMAYFLEPTNATVLAMISEANEIPGPTFAIAPAEFVAEVQPKAANPR